MASIYAHNQTVGNITLDDGLILLASSSLDLSEYFSHEKITNSILLTNQINNDNILLSQDGSNLFSKSESLDYQLNFVVQDTPLLSNSVDPILNRSLRIWNQIVNDQAFGFSYRSNSPFLSEYIFTDNSTIFSDNFEANNLNNWAIVKNPGGATGNWTVTTTNPLSGTYSAQAVGQNGSLATYDLRRSQSTLVYSSIFLEFLVNHSGAESDDFSSVVYTTDGSNWNTLLNSDTYGSIATITKTVLFPVSASTNSNFGFGIRWSSNAANDTILIDNVTLRGRLLGVTSGSSPYSSRNFSVLNSNYSKAVVVANVSGTTGGITVQVSKDGGSTWTSATSVLVNQLLSTGLSLVYYTDPIDISGLTPNTTMRVRFNITGDYRLRDYGVDFW